jgi:adenylate cyclase, class 2
MNGQMQPTTTPNCSTSVRLWEVEQKFHLEDEPAMEAALQELDFEICGIEQHHDTYWQHPAKDFRKSDEAFRIRRINDIACMTYKGPREVTATVKTREEIELDINASQYEQWLRMLGLLGFQPQPAVVKSRHLYRSTRPEWHGIVVAVDHVEQLGAFVEIEQLVSSSEQLDVARGRISQLALRLGLVNAQPHSYLSQLLVRRSETT